MAQLVAAVLAGSAAVVLAAAMVACALGGEDHPHGPPGGSDAESGAPAGP